MRVLGVDSDTRYVGASLWDGQKISAVGILKRYPGWISSPPPIKWMKPDLILIEFPEITKAHTMRGVKPQNLVTLAGAAGEVGGILQTVFPKAELRYVLPKTWKGSVPKPIAQERYAREIGLEGERMPSYYKVKDWGELTTFVYPSGKISSSIMQHGLDAAGIALWASKLRRLPKSAI